MRKTDKPSDDFVRWVIIEGQAGRRIEEVAEEAVKRRGEICGTIADDKPKKADGFSRFLAQVQSGEIREEYDPELAEQFEASGLIDKIAEALETDEPETIH